MQIYDKGFIQPWLSASQSCIFATTKILSLKHGFQYKETLVIRHYKFEIKQATIKATIKVDGQIYKFAAAS